MSCVNFDDTVQLDTLLRHVTPTINNLPYELGVDLLRQAFTEFCRRTEILSSLQEVQPQKDVSDYELIPPEGYEVYKVKEVSRGSSTISTPNAHYWYSGWGMQFAVIGTKYVVLRNSPNNDSDPPFNISFTVLPNECVTQIPREISIPYGRQLGLQALSTVLKFKSKPWYDPGLAAKFERDYYNAVQSGINLNLMNRGGSNMEARTKRWV